MTSKTTMKNAVKNRYDQQDLTVPRDMGTNEIVLHTEWNGWLYCEYKSKAFEWEYGEVSCPYCELEFTVPKPNND